VDHLCVWRDRRQQKGSVASSRVALVAKQSAGFFVCEANHLPAFGDRFGQFELAGVNALEVFMTPCSRGGTPISGRPERAKMDVIYSNFCQRVPQWSL
jgi:hypothetical protein